MNEEVYSPRRQHDTIKDIGLKDRLKATIHLQQYCKIFKSLKNNVLNIARKYITSKIKFAL